MGAGATGIPTFISSSLIKNNNVSSYESDRTVWIASLSQDGIEGSSIKNVIHAAIKQMEYAIPFSPDIYCLPELFILEGQRRKGLSPVVDEVMEDGSGNLIGEFQIFAKTHSCYIVCPVYTQRMGIITMQHC